jgi:hypothetical protein
MLKTNPFIYFYTYQKKKKNTEQLLIIPTRLMIYNNIEYTGCYGSPRNKFNHQWDSLK